jgi:hypothetical protein
MAGYSGTPLPQKLGIKEGHRVALVGAPAGFAATLTPLPPVKLGSKLAAADVILFFTRSRAELEKRLPALDKALDPDGGLWICWPKKTSGVATDMTEDVVRQIALPGGRLVDNKVCAIDDTWSGLRLVVRREKRPTRR